MYMNAMSGNQLILNFKSSDAFNDSVKGILLYISSSLNRVMGEERTKCQSTRESPQCSDYTAGPFGESGRSV